ncbi:MAG TPA: hypothetical protein PL045_07800, partial [Chitinophagaceae bacterium]|nr:hypothetical protein [Chitinophagaceae bacterium]
DRVFSFTTGNANDSSDGWWQHFKATWDGSYDYVIAPIRNEFWTGIENDAAATGYMNTLDTTGDTNELKLYEPVVPQPRVKYVIEQIFKEHGWTVDFSGLNDNDWEKLFMLAVKPLYICETTYTFIGSGIEVGSSNIPLGTLTIRLNEFMPDMTCSEFITALCLRYGWAPIPDITKRNCRFVAVKEMRNKPAKNWTAYSAPESNSDLLADKKIFAFKNIFEGNDQFPSSPGFEGFTIGTPVQNFAALPSAYSGYDNTLIFCFEENQWFQVVYNYDLSERQWVVFADNIYDAEEDNATDTFETKCTTLPYYKTLYRTDTDDFYASFLFCKQSRNEAFGLRTFFYHGLIYERKADGTAGSRQYPYCSSTCVQPGGTVALAWSNVYKHNNGSTTYGIIEYWWRSWLNLLNTNEDAVKKRFNLPLHELIRFKWDDIILDKNVQYIVKQMTEPLPYRGFVECIMHRLLQNKEVLTSKVYLHLETEVLLTDQDFSLTLFGYTYNWNNATTATVKVKAYSDEALTQELSVTGLAFTVKRTTTKDGTYYSDFTYTYTLNGHELNIPIGLYPVIEYDYSDDNPYGSPDGHYVLTHELLVGEGYIIVP